MKNYVKTSLIVVAMAGVLFQITYMVTKIMCGNSLSIYGITSENQGKIPLKSNIDSVKIIYESIYFDHIEDRPRVIIEEIEEKFSSDRDNIKNMSRYEVQNSFSKNNYILKNIKNDEIIFARNVPGYRYKPNKYVIGIDGEFVAILKSDDKGKLNLENKRDVSKIKISDIPSEDVELLNMGDIIYEFDTKEEAEEALEGIFMS